ncbi:chaperonin [Culex quinquefasciatus]|uniref:Chaperonin n=1 Tax=Culex quinquefasciatus TaxID=7176 RepID=B0WST0_CULQU|nr:chaperonin [Culex quinquefasciatus]|eukprot:XP_001870707.1 chaperonin [Culex quinquefasciatus]
MRLAWNDFRDGVGVRVAAMLSEAEKVSCWTRRPLCTSRTQVNARFLIANTPMDTDKIKDSMVKIAVLEVAEKEKMKDKVITRTRLVSVVAICSKVCIDVIARHGAGISRKEASCCPTETSPQSGKRRNLEEISVEFEEEKKFMEQHLHAGPFLPSLSPIEETVPRSELTGYDWFILMRKKMTHWRKAHLIPPHLNHSLSP